MSTSPRLRCAIYTRKSTEEGLEQEFNSLRCPARSLRRLYRFAGRTGLEAGTGPL